MAAVGEEMVNPVSRERFVWRHTAESTDGEFCQFDLHLGEGALVAAPHLHPGQQERFEVKSGSIRLRSQGQEELLYAGDVRTIESGAVHAWGNAASEETLVTVRLTPALRSEAFLPPSARSPARAGRTRRGCRATPCGSPSWRMSTKTWRGSRERPAALRL
jgi:quercetin dioxygenase-like cupin family protein